MPVVQLLLAAAACFGLWRLCRAQPTIAIVGFLIRAFLAQALFWTSYLHLPIARSLQLGNGFWFFAVDGPFYLKYATNLAEQGPVAILFLGDQYPSRFFVQVLSLFVGAFGGVASVAILLNGAAYLLTCAIVARLGRNDVVLAAIAFSPASILFSLQPLKDTLFMLLIVAAFAAFRRWEELWRAGGTRTQFLVCALAMLAAVYALADIRWYFAAIVCGSSAIFCVLAALPARRRGWALATNAVLFVLLAQSFRLGALDLPPSFARLLNPMTAVRWRPASAKAHIAEVRKGFERTPGATTIAPGTALEPPTTPPPPTPTQTQTPVSTQTQASTPTPTPTPAPTPTTTAAEAPAPAPTTRPESQTVVSRLTTGSAAMFLPRVLAESLGIIRVGGGRGLWLFAELDTIAFDLVLLYAIVYCARSLRRRRARMTATFVLCVLVFVMTAGPMIYTVNNFGTLFRLRLMVYFLAAILPITLRHPYSIERSDAVQ
ncbi:MAG: hypothetical protein JJE51_02475 [Thermoanaerobaculia bacterium]|nr:hypothetical protein [Thermoanaerobaculia bacterium]